MYKTVFLIGSFITLLTISCKKNRVYYCNCTTSTFSSQGYTVSSVQNTFDIETTDYNKTKSKKAAEEKCSLKNYNNQPAQNGYTESRTCYLYE
jgi:hypothetical protein